MKLNVNIAIFRAELSASSDSIVEHTRNCLEVVKNSDRHFEQCPFYFSPEFIRLNVSHILFSRQINFLVLCVHILPCAMQ